MFDGACSLTSIYNLHIFENIHIYATLRADVLFIISFSYVRLSYFHRADCSWYYLGCVKMVASRSRYACGHTKLTIL